MNIGEIDLWDDRIMLDGHLVARVAHDADSRDMRKFYWLIREIRNDPVRADEIEGLREALNEAERDYDRADDRADRLASDLRDADDRIEKLEKEVEGLEQELEEYRDHD